MGFGASTPALRSRMYQFDKVIPADGRWEKAEVLCKDMDGRRVFTGFSYEPIIAWGVSLNQRFAVADNRIALTDATMWPITAEGLSQELSNFLVRRDGVVWIDTIAEGRFMSEKEALDYLQGEEDFFSTLRKDADVQHEPVKRRHLRVVAKDEGSEP